MKLIRPSFEILAFPKDLSILELAGRTCYKSEEKMAPGTAEKFIRGVISRGHESVIEHLSATVRVICDRGVTHEIVRHRLASYSQESTQYCNYGGGVTFVIPPWVKIMPGEYLIEWEGLHGKEINPTPYRDLSDSWWFWSMASAERNYKKLLFLGWSPQHARAVLPNSLKTEIVMTMNLREWRHFFRLRTKLAAHPQMREIAVPLLSQFQELVPVIFEEIIAKKKEAQ